jgi:hypothetical protein
LSVESSRHHAAMVPHRRAVVDARVLAAIAVWFARPPRLPGPAPARQLLEAG